MAECLRNLDELSFDLAAEKELAYYAKALAHPARIRLLTVLAAGGCLGSDLVEQLGLAQSTVSEHLRILREAGFVHAEVQHPRTCFSLKPEAVARARELLALMLEQ
ncbi:ArsR/SmtB family transcription factor [Parendozoicomonas haliclonae]|uniref:HTH-type transcriptional regulator CmtR n=1 Tax=Parendozoicomonas haliclonae TaxID=1960125 RepID=A0A1X7ATA1_9GAMM|nr:metalloregulator ArsR/SmtB family transcription factor [Parendozoicomonas haliclonae]SMA50627.1 HTH-type transcriptional regulator CmtR [Parendozoicomonas haliclonae]